MQARYPIFFYALFMVFVSVNSVNVEAKENRLFSFSGKIEYSFIDYYQAGSSGDSIQWNEVKFYPQLKFAAKDNLSFMAEGILRENLNYQGRSYSIAKEAYASFYLDSIDLTLGKQIISWGVSDEIKPMDYFRIGDYTDLLRKEEEGVLALRAIYYLPKANIDFVWAPLFDAHRISYDQENPWAGVPRQGVSFMVNNDLKPARNIGSSQFGLRVGCQGEGIDYSFAYIYGIDRFPTIIRMKEIGYAGSWPLMEILPLYRRIHLLGMDWNKSFSTWNLKGEFVYVLTDDPHLEPYLKAVIGGERYFSRLWRDIELFALIQLVMDKQWEEERSQSFLQNEIDYNHPFQYATTLNLDLKFSESYSLLIKGIVDMEGDGQIWQSELKWRLRDSLVIYAGADYIHGQKGTYFGFFRDNDRFLTGVRFSF